MIGIRQKIEDMTDVITVTSQKTKTSYAVEFDLFVEQIKEMLKPAKKTTSKKEDKNGKDK